VVKIRKYGEINNTKAKENYRDSHEDNLQFILWKAELNRDLQAFWKAMLK